MRGYPQFSFWISITFVRFDFPHIHKPRKNNFELIGTVLKQLRQNLKTKRKNIVSLDRATRQCGRWIHQTCARNLMQEANLCTGVSTFVSCYQEHVSRFPYVNGKCREQVPEITQKFNTLIQQFSTDLIGKYKYSLNQEQMCLVDKSVVDTES